MKRIYGDKFTLLNKNSVKTLGLKYRKDWRFRHEENPRKDAIQKIVAESDYLRLKTICYYGGFWLDADTVAIRDFRQHFPNATLDTDLLLWHSEQFFGAQPGNMLLEKAYKQMEKEEMQSWGNPGGIKNAIKENLDLVQEIPFFLVNPQNKEGYSYENCEIILEEGKAEDFLRGNKQCFLKLYNTAFANSRYGEMTPDIFLRTDTILADIFRSLEPNIDWWLREVEIIKEELTRN